MTDLKAAKRKINYCVVLGSITTELGKETGMQVWMIIHPSVIFGVTKILVCVCTVLEGVRSL